MSEDEAKRVAKLRDILNKRLLGAIDAAKSANPLLVKYCESDANMLRIVLSHIDEIWRIK